MFSTPLEEMSFDDFQEKLEEATKPMTMEEATNEKAKNIKKALALAYEVCRKISWKGYFFRADIGS